MMLSIQITKQTKGGWVGGVGDEVRQRGPAVTASANCGHDPQSLYHVYTHFVFGSAVLVAATVVVIYCFEDKHTDITYNSTWQDNKWLCWRSAEKLIVLVVSARRADGHGDAYVMARMSN